jgi:hypothetical protein
MKKNSFTSFYESALYWITADHVTLSFGGLSAFCGILYGYLRLVLANYAKVLVVLQNLESKELTRAAPLMISAHDSFFQNSAVLQEYIIRCTRFSEVMKILLWICLIVFLLSIMIRTHMEARYLKSRASVLFFTLLEALSYLSLFF